MEASTAFNHAYVTYTHLESKKEEKNNEKRATFFAK